MGVRTRHYLFDDDGVPKRLTQRLVAHLRERGGTISEHASQRRRIIVVTLVVEGQKPPMLIQAVGRYWVFDERGGLSEHLLQEHKDIVCLLPGAFERFPGEPYNAERDEARRDAVRREIIERTIWTPTDTDMEPVIRDIWHMPLSKWLALDLEIPAARH